MYSYVIILSSSNIYMSVYEYTDIHMYTQTHFDSKASSILYGRVVDMEPV